MTFWDLKTFWSPVVIDMMYINFPPITRHCLLVWGITWLSHPIIHHFTEGHDFCPYIVQKFKMLCKTSVIISYDTVQPYKVYSINFSHVTHCFMVIVQSIKRFSPAKLLYHLTNYQCFRSHFAQGFKMVYSTISIIISQFSMTIWQCMILKN